MINLLTVDLEDYYHVSGMADVAPIEKWDDFKSRIENNVDVLLETLGETKATFFVLGWVAEKYPCLIRKISGSGHEIASHGRNHRLISHMTKEEFANDLEASIKLLEVLTGEPIIGYRAPSFSITEQTLWAFEVMANQGLKYDSSVFPKKRRRGGMRKTGLKPYILQTPLEEIAEFPLTVWTLLGKRLPVGGGGFFRLYPYWMTKSLIKSVNSSGRPVIVYLHPWELDFRQPRLKSSFSRNGFNHYIGLKSTSEKLLKKKLFKKLKKLKITILKGFFYPLIHLQGN